MNLVLLSFAALMLMCMLIGYKRGLIKSVLSVVGIVGAMLLANICYPYVGGFLKEHTVIADIVRGKIAGFVGEEEINEADDVYDKEMYVENLKVPEMVKNYIRSGDYDDTENKADIRNYAGYITDYMTSMVISGISYTISVLTAMLILLIAFSVSGILTEIPIVKGIDKVGGLVFGMAQAVLITWIAMIVITLLSAFPWGTDLMKNIDDSIILTYIYKNNYFLKIIVDILSNV